MDANRWLVCVSFVAAGCSGFTFGENAPGDPQYGGGTYLDDAYVTEETPAGVAENGSIAVDPDTEIAFTLQARESGDKRIMAADSSGRAWEVMRVDGYRDVRILFTPGNIVVLGEPLSTHFPRCERSSDRVENLCGDELFWFDKSARSLERSKRTGSSYHGTRQSPGRNFLAVADNFQDPSPVHIVNMSSGTAVEIDRKGEWFEGMWLRNEDVFVTASFGTEDDPYLEIREMQVDQDGLPSRRDTCVGNPDTLPEHCDIVLVPDSEPTFLDGFSWVGISPDDRFIAVPASHGDDAVVVVVDRLNDEVRFARGVRGPVGFAPDSSHMIGYGFDDEGQAAELQVVDLATFEIERIALGSDAPLPSFYATRDGKDVVVSMVFGTQGVLVVDLESGDTTQMAAPIVAEEGYRAELEHRRRSVDRRQLRANDLIAEQAITANLSPCDQRVCKVGEQFTFTLLEFVSRPEQREMWLVEEEQLIQLDLDTRFARRIPLDGSPQHINILPRQDLLVLDAKWEERLTFLDPDSLRTVADAPLSVDW